MVLERCEDDVRVFRLVPGVGEEFMVSHHPKPLDLLGLPTWNPAGYQPPPVSDELVHSVNEILFLFRHVYELPLNTAHLFMTATVSLGSLPPPLIHT